MRVFKKSALAPLFLAPAAWLAVSCATVPETNRQQLILIDQRAELALGREAYREVMAGEKLSTDRALVRKVEEVGRRIARVTGRTGYQWEFNLFETEEPNAFCLPGGKVGVNTGILPIALNEAGLAAIIGHEAGHAIARHGAERMSQGMIIAVGGEALAYGMGGNEQDRQLVRAAYGLGTAVTLTLPFSRSHELEADYLGLLYMARAGYDPREAVRLWERFAKYKEEKGGQAIEFLSTHPAGERRIERIRGWLPEAMAEYEKSARFGLGKPLL